MNSPRQRDWSTLIVSILATAIMCLASPAQAQWRTTQWIVTPVQTDRDNPGWKDKSDEQWDGKSPTRSASSSIQIDTGRDSDRTRIYYKDKNKPDLLKITPPERAVVRVGLEDASRLLQASGFKQPHLDMSHSFWQAWLFPDPYIYDHGTKNTKDLVWAQYMPYAATNGPASARLYVGHDWRDDTGIAFAHELFHSVQASYPGFNKRHPESAATCAVTCWIEEGMAEGFAAHWATQGGSALVGKTYRVRSSRSFETPLAATTYQEGQDTGRFWDHVARENGLNVLSRVMDQAATAKNDGVKGVDDGFKSTGHPGLSSAFVRFVAKELRTQKEFKTIPRFALDADRKPMVEQKISFERLAARAIRIRLELDPDLDGEITIDARDGGANNMHVLIEEDTHNAVASVPLTRTDGRYDFLARIVNANPDAAQTVAQRPNIVVSVELFECPMLPAHKVRRLDYEQIDPKGKRIATLSYDFSNAQRKEKSIVNVRMQMNLPGQSKNEVDVAFRCTKDGVVADGTYALGGVDLGPVKAGRAAGPMSLTQVQNTLTMPNNPKPGMKLPNGAASFKAAVGGVAAVQIDVKQTDRKILGREKISVPGAGTLDTWKMSASASFGMNIGASGLIGNAASPGQQGAMDMMEQIMSMQGKSMSAKEKAALAPMLSAAGNSPIMQQAMDMLGSALAEQSRGTETLWFHRGIGVVKQESITASGKSTTRLVRVVYH